MKKFFLHYSFYAVKMFINQFAISLFGMTLSMVFTSVESPIGQLLSSIFSVLFYLFLLYNMTWDLGYKDRIAKGHGTLDPKPLNGLYTSLLANSINFILAVFAILKFDFASFAIIIEGMYAGIMMYIANGAEIPTWLYMAIIAPAILISSASYYLGLKDIRLIPWFNFKYKEKK